MANRRRPLLTLVAACFSALCGCSYTRTPAQPAPGTSALRESPPPKWPRNWTQELPRATLPPMRFNIRNNDGTSTEFEAAATERTEPLGGGWIVATEGQVYSAGGTPADYESFDYYAWRERPAPLDDTGNTDPWSRLHAMRASAPYHMAFTLRLPANRPIRGLVMHQWGLAGYRFEKGLVEEFLGRGWAVLNPNGLTWRRPGALTIAPDSPQSSIAPSAQPSAEVTPAAFAQATAALAASEFDDALGQYALANEAALLFVRERHPEIPEHPLVLIGCSFGGINSPAVAARLGDRLDASVLVGAGANFLEIAGNEWMDYYYSRIRGRNSTELHVPATLRPTILAGYLERSTLDPFHTATAMIGKPVLMLHAKGDMIVPARNGDLLWEQLGRPERWTGNFGHLLMFATLSGQKEAIADWVERATQPDARPR
ncbi:MAG: alpha/beta hydrolase [Planctomycetes bacterium]|nr:alpha/beta hydrolase [Planctomycetota bacterium]